MNKKPFFFALAAMTFCSAQAQKITTKSEIIDCGQIVFRQPYTAKFDMKNADTRTLHIHQVRTSCGCAVADYPRIGIEGQRDFQVYVTYDAKQMGHFEKQIAVYSNGSDKPFMLTLRGVVVDKVRHYEGKYDFTLGLLNADKNHLEFDDINKGERPYQEIHIQNLSSQPATPVVMHLPNYLKAEVSPSTIASGHAGVVRIWLDSKQLRNYGLTQTSVYLGAFPGDKVSEEKEISISSVLLPDFRAIDEDRLATAPQLRMSSESLDLGSFEGKDKKSGTIIIENTGKETLEINSLQMFTTGLEISLNKKKLKAGDSAKLKITADRKMLKTARSKPRILMITNDPKKPKVVININVQ
ncbi:MAG: DUF1573 domain-containing protein [Prevotella sp.]|nr:DUF1573 domain-containing protein [Prevotella sp.]